MASDEDEEDTDEAVAKTERPKQVLDALPAKRVDTATSVAVDVGWGPERPSRRWGALSAQVAAAVLALVGTSYALSRAGVFEAGVASHPTERSSSPATRVLALAPSAPSVPLDEKKDAVAPAIGSEATAAAAATAAPQDSTGSAAAAGSAAPTPVVAEPVVKEPASKEPAAEAASKPAAATSAPAAAGASSSPAVAASTEAGAVVASTAAPAVAAPPVAAPAAEASSSAPSSTAEPEAASGDEVGKDNASGAKKSVAERRAERAARRAAAVEARRARRAAAQKPSTEKAAAAPPSATEASSSTPEPGSNFDRQAAQAALSSAADQAKNCRPIGGPSGAGTVQVQYEPSGKVSAVTIVTAGFENSEAGSCIQMLFRRARIPQFNGTQPVVLRQRFEIP